MVDEIEATIAATVPATEDEDDEPLEPESGQGIVDVEMPDAGDDEDPVAESADDDDEESDT